VHSALQQCETNAKKDGLTPLLVFSRNHCPTYATLRFEHFLEMQHAASLSLTTYLATDATVFMEEKDNEEDAPSDDEDIIDLT
jgi:hypothetical protein